MFNRWFIATVLLITAGALALVIYQDSRERTTPQEPVSSTGDAETYDQVAHYEELDEQRVTYVLSVLDTLENQRAGIPYHGELIRRYEAAGIFDQAAEQARHIADVTGDADDWKQAGDLYLQQVRNTADDELSKKSGKMAESMYIEALNQSPGNTDLKTDLAVVYMSLLQPEKSYDWLMRALDSEPDHIRANFNAGVLLHQMGNPEQSIAFFDRVSSLADEDDEWQEVVQRYLDQYHQELYH